MFYLSIEMLAEQQICVRPAAGLLLQGRLVVLGRCQSDRLWSGDGPRVVLVVLGLTAVPSPGAARALAPWGPQPQPGTVGLAGAMQPPPGWSGASSCCGGELWEGAGPWQEV